MTRAMPPVKCMEHQAAPAIRDRAPRQSPALSARLVKSTGTARRRDTAMTHLAIQEALDGKMVEWMEHVSEEQYQTWVSQHQK